MLRQLAHLDHGQFPGDAPTVDHINEVLLMQQTGRTWTTHGPWSENVELMAIRIAKLAGDGRLSVSHPGMVLVAGPEESEEISLRLQNFLPALPVRNLTADDRLSPGKSRASHQAVTEEAAVRVISYRMFRESRQSFWNAGGSVVFLDGAQRLAAGGEEYRFAKQLAHAAQSVHVFATTGLLDHPGSTFHLASLLGLTGFPPTLQRFKTAYVRSTGYGMNEVMGWLDGPLPELVGLLDLHHYHRVQPGRFHVVQRILPTVEETIQLRPKEPTPS